MTTKAQAKRKVAYLKQLARCGFRSWKRANQRRGELIDKFIYDKATPISEQLELARLQRLADLYVAYRTNDALRRHVRALDKQLKALESRHDSR